MIVASFYAPRYEKWGLKEQGYHACLRLLDNSCKRLGLRHVVISDSERPGFETFVCPLPEPLMQAILSGQMQFLEQVSGPSLLVGADCLLTADPQGVLGDADMAITLGPFADCKMNTGAIFVRDGARCSGIWKSALESNPTVWGDDQTSLYRAILASDLNIKELACTEYNWAPESPDDSAGMPMVVHFRGPRKGWMAKWYAKFLKDGAPQHHFRRGANVSIDQIMEQFKANCTRDLPWFIGPPKPRDNPLAIVGGGPSLKDSLTDIRIRKNMHKATIWAMNNAWRPLVEAKIRPDAIVMMDARPENVEFVKDGPDCEYLIASMCHPDLFEALHGKKVTVWHADQTGYAELAHLQAYNHRPWCLVPGGGTVGLRSMVLGFYAGFVEQHLYGMDSSYREGAHHAYPQAINDGEQVIEIGALGKTYRCAGWMARQADEFVRFRGDLVERGCRIWAHGSGLIPDLGRHLNKEQGNGRRKAV